MAELPPYPFRKDVIPEIIPEPVVTVSTAAPPPSPSPDPEPEPVESVLDTLGVDREVLDQEIKKVQEARIKEVAEQAPAARQEKQLRLISGRTPPPPGTKAAKRLARRTEENLTPKMKAIRDRFIVEYLRDWNGPLAYIRAGGCVSTATKMASEYLREPYVACKILDVVDSMEESQLLSRKTVLAGLIREAQYTGMGASHGARVSAWGKLANILGMEQTNVNVKGKVDHEVRGGVMVVPVVPGTPEWEMLATSSQKQLKEDVKT